MVCNLSLKNLKNLDKWRTKEDVPDIKKKPCASSADERFSSKIYRNEVWFKDSAQYCIISGCHIDMLEK